LLSANGARADGIIQDLPEDGSWVEFAMKGEGVDLMGKIAVTVEGMLTIRSVGRETIDGEAGRWIEVGTAASFQRGGQKEKQTEIRKMLIPERRLVSGENPLAHLRKGKRKRDDDQPTEIQVPGPGAEAGGIPNELFHAPLPPIQATERINVETPAGTF